MAMEIKTVEVANENEESTIRFFSQFAWNLKSSQRIYNKDTHLENRKDGTYSVTETVDFTKLVFERDKNHPHYATIVAYETKYLAGLEMLPKNAPPSYDSIEDFASKVNIDIRNKKQRSQFKILLISGIIIAAVFHFLIWMSLCGDSFWLLALTFLGFVAGIGVFISSFVTKSKNKNKMIEKALNGEDAEAAAALKEKYDAAVQKSNEYNGECARLDHILDELEKIV